MPIEPIKDVSQTPIALAMERVKSSAAQQLELKGLTARDQEQPVRMRQVAENQLNQQPVQKTLQSPQILAIQEERTAELAGQMPPTTAPQLTQPMRGTINLTA